MRLRDGATRLLGMETFARVRSGGGRQEICSNSFHALLILSLSKDVFESSRHRRKSKEYNMFGVRIFLPSTSFDRLRMRSVWRELAKKAGQNLVKRFRAKVSIPGRAEGPYEVARSSGSDST